MTPLDKAVKNFKDDFLSQFIDEYSIAKSGEPVLYEGTLSKDANAHLKKFRSSIEEELGEATGEWKKVLRLVEIDSTIDRFSSTTEEETINLIYGSEEIQHSDIPLKNQIDVAQERGQDVYSDLKDDAMHDIKLYMS